MPEHTHRYGFTLVEILLVMVIIGIMLVVVVPRAWRAHTDAKYGLVREAGVELGAFANQWVERQLAAQPVGSSISANDYLGSLVGQYTGNMATSNWNKQGSQTQVTGSQGDSITPVYPVEDIAPPEQLPVNSFNGASYFSASNGGSFLTPGLLYADSATDSGWDYYAFVFTGTDSDSLTEFHAGQSLTLEGLRNGIFIARAR